MPQTIDSIDRFFLTLFNGSHSMFLDEFALLFTNTVAWVPLFIALIILVVKNNEKTSQVMLLLGAVALGFLLSDGLADGIVKPLDRAVLHMAIPDIRRRRQADQTADVMVAAIIYRA